jgi:hypothetical protein
MILHISEVVTSVAFYGTSALALLSVIRLAYDLAGGNVGQARVRQVVWSAGACMAVASGSALVSALV